MVWSMKWEEESYTRRDENGNLVTVEEYEAKHKRTGIRSFMSWNDAKLYAICGVGFFVDSYDLFIINQVSPIWQYEYWGGLAHPPPKKGPSYPTLLRGAVNAAANIGNIIGQLMFGFLGDSFGRKFVYGKEMIVAIVGIILIISLPNSIEPTHDKFWYLFGFRILMGIGIGGDYPMSAAIVAERSTLQNRGRMLGFIFSNQGWGNLTTSIVTLILLGCFSAALQRGEYNQLDAIWRLQIGLALIPCAATLYQRLTMPDSRKFLQSTELSSLKTIPSDLSVDSTQKVPNGGEKQGEKSAIEETPENQEALRRASAIEAHMAEPTSNKAKYAVFVEYFSEWRHLKHLIGTASTWFLVDVGFYGTNLNQSLLLSQIGFAKGSTEYHTLVLTALGNLIIAVAGYVPGYFITIALIEKLGRKWIQTQGFLVTALMFGIIAGASSVIKSGDNANTVGTAGTFVCFVITQLFFNFGPNATTFIVPAEAFPSRVRGLAHGFSAAVGKLGAILAGVLFNYLSDPKRWGTATVLWIFFVVNIIGAIMTVLFVPETTGIDADAVDYEECLAKVSGGKVTGGILYQRDEHSSWLTKIWRNGI